MRGSSSALRLVVNHDELALVRLGPGDGAGGCKRSAGDCAQGVHARGKNVGAVYVVAQQLTLTLWFVIS